MGKDVCPRELAPAELVLCVVWACGLLSSPEHPGRDGASLTKEEKTRSEVGVLHGAQPRVSVRRALAVHFCSHSSVVIVQLLVDTTQTKDTSWLFLINKAMDKWGKNTCLLAPVDLCIKSALAENSSPKP